MIVMRVFSGTKIKAMDLIKDRNEEHKILFLQSWNEWGESNLLNLI